MKRSIFYSTLMILFSVHSFSQQNVPELLTAKNGNTISSAKQWEKIRRPEILAMVETEMYGVVPGELKIAEVKLLEQDDQALNGKAIRKQVKLTFRGNQKELSVELLLYLPKGKKSYPTFLGYNFGGNHTILNDTAIHIAKEWNGAARPRGVETANWEVEKLINAGCGVATMYYWDIAPDREDFSIGIYPLLYKAGQTKPANNEWGSLAAWAWGLSRALDYLKTDKQVDGSKVVVIGHSRLGKASLWAGARDQRFAAVISNNSGCGGASIYRDKAGETLLKMNNRFPRWTAVNFKKYTDNESLLPFDQHMVLAMVAPRPLYVASASEDAWADPKNEFKSAVYATQVYHLYGLKGIESNVFPALNTPVGEKVAYHIRNGKHDILAYDWEQYINFAKKYLMGTVAQESNSFKIPAVSNPEKRIQSLKDQWNALHQSPPRIGVRDCFIFLLDALDTRFLKPEEILWTIDLVKTRIIADSTKPSFGNMYWGWTETGGDVGDGNNVEFCVQYGILIKLLFNDRLSPEARASLDDLFAQTLNGIRRQPVRISYTNIYVMRCWNLLALGQVYKNPVATAEGTKAFDLWLKHVANYGNREFDSPTYCGVDLESLLLMYRFVQDKAIKAKAADALEFFLTDLSAHYNKAGGYLEGAHSRDYNRVFGRDLLEEKYMDPLLGKPNNNNELFNQVCFSILKELNLSKAQQKVMEQKDKFIIQRWDSMPHTYAYDYHGKKFSIASSNQYYSPDDKSFIAYLSSKKIPAMPNIVYVAEGRNDHYGTWGAEGMGEKMKHLMPPNYPANGGWGKTRHLMPFMQTVQHKNEFVMLVAGMKDHNCINPYINSTVILPHYFEQIWLGNQQVGSLKKGDAIAFDETNTFFGKFEDVGVAIRILWSNADKNERPQLINDGFSYEPRRENFSLPNNKAIRFTLKHPNDGLANISMWWKIEEGLTDDAKFNAFRQSVLNTKVEVSDQKGVVDVAVYTGSGKLGLKADVRQKQRLDYYSPLQLPKDFLFNINGVELGRKIMEKYRNL